MSDDGGHVHLATGWDPGTLAGDTLLRACSLGLAEVETGRRLGRRTLATDAFGAVDLGEPAGLINVASLLQPLPHQGWEATVGAIEAFFAGGRGEADLFSPWPTPDLRPRGWHLHGHPPLMLREPGPAPGPPTAPAGLRVEAVTDAGALADFERTLVEAFPVADAGPLLPGGLFGPALLDDRRWRLLVGYDDGPGAGPSGDGGRSPAAPVATAAALVDHGLVVVNYVSTRPGHRGRGYGAALTWAATRADPSAPAVLLASDAGRPVYERLGYRALLRFTLWGLFRP